MKSRRWFVILTLLLAGTLIGVTQSVVVTATTNSPTALVLVKAVTPAELGRLEQTNVAIFARLSEGAFLVGADPAQTSQLAAAKLASQVLDANISGADYYNLVYLLPGQIGVERAEYGRLLHATADVTILRSTPEQTKRLAADGFQVQGVTLDPKPLWPHPAHIPADIEPDPVIQSMMDQVISSTVYQYTGGLSGEWPVTIGGSAYTIATRYTYSGTPIEKATQFVGEHLAELGLDVTYHQWSGSTYPNVIGEITGQVNPDDIYIFSAHLDDMPLGATAPGADDNASGVVAALIAADIFSQYNWGCTIRFGLWTGEEQGLLGSHAYAQHAYNQGENIRGVINLDMISWNTPGSSRDIDLHANAAMPATLTLAQLFAEAVADYEVNLIPGIVPNGTGASDHASFWQYGYTAILGIEDFGDFNPRYHTVNDRLQYLDMDYYTDFVKASVATFAHMSDCLMACEPVQVMNVTTAVDACTVDFSPVYTGTTPINWEWVFQGGNPASSSLAAPTGIDFGVSGTYAYMLTANNCAGIPAIYADTVTVSCDGCTPITNVLVSQVTTGTIFAGDVVTLSLEVLPETAVPYTYTVMVGETAVITAQTGITTPILFNHPFTTPGSFTITVIAWNCDLAKPLLATLNIEILPQPQPDYLIYLPAVRQDEEALQLDVAHVAPPEGSFHQRSMTRR